MSAGNKSSFTTQVKSEGTSTEPAEPSNSILQNSPKACNTSPEVLRHPPAMDLLLSVSISADVYKQKIIDLAVKASEELRIMALEQEPLWVFDSIKNKQVLNAVEYKQRFAPLDGPLEEIIRMITSGEPLELPNLSNNEDQFMDIGVGSLETKASRAIGYVNMNITRLLSTFMKADQWAHVFSNMVSKAANLGILLDGEQKNLDGFLQVMSAELHISSPIYKGREIYFARYCRRLASDTWMVVDVSLEKVFPNLKVKCQRKPSGCVIQIAKDGISKVTWVENNTVCDNSAQDLYRQLVASGNVFEATRWVTTLERYSDKILILESQNSNGRGEKESHLKAAERMVNMYLANIKSCTENGWRPISISEAEDVVVRTSYNQNDPRTAKGVAINIATTIWLPVPPAYLYDFLRNGTNRNKWDLLSMDRITREVKNFPTCRYPGCEVSVVVAEPKPNTMLRLYLQESFTDSTGYYVIFAPMDIFAINHMTQGKNPDAVSLLPSGFTILPDGLTRVHGESIIKGSVLTIAFQIIDEELKTPDFVPSAHITGVYNIVKETVRMIKSALFPNPI